MTRTKVVAGNWKLNKTIPETRRLINEIRNRLAGIDTRAQVVVCPPFVSLEAAVDAARESSIRVGAQDVFWESEGAFTGEVSAEMLAGVGVEFVIVGHSERRQLFGETDEAVNRKALKLTSVGLTPIICVGETLTEHEAGEVETVVGRQVAEALADLPPDHAPRVVMAYEPIWAIGTGRTSSPEATNDVHVLIRRLVAAMFGSGVAEQVRILYGGSVKPSNAGRLMSENDIDGVLVGGASLDGTSFAEIIASAG